MRHHRTLNPTSSPVAVESPTAGRITTRASQRFVRAPVMAFNSLGAPSTLESRRLCRLAACGRCKGPIRVRVRPASSHRRRSIARRRSPNDAGRLLQVLWRLAGEQSPIAGEGGAPRARGDRPRGQKPRPRSRPRALGCNQHHAEHTAHHGRSLRSRAANRGSRRMGSQRESCAA